MSVIHYCNLMNFITIDPNLFKFNKIFFKNYGQFDDSDTWLQHLIEAESGDYRDVKASLCCTMNARPAKATWQNYPTKLQRK